MLDDVERAYRSAEGSCIEALYDLHRFMGKEAIEDLKSAIRSIEHAHRLAAQQRRREMARPIAAAFVEPPSAPVEF